MLPKSIIELVISDESQKKYEAELNPLPYIAVESYVGGMLNY